MTLGCDYHIINNLVCLYELNSYQMKSINIFDYAIELLLILRNKSIVTKIMFNHKEYHLLLYLFKN